MPDPPTDSPDTGDKPKEEKPPDVVFEPEDIIKLTRDFKAKRFDQHADQILDGQIHLVRLMKNLVRPLPKEEPQPSTSHQEERLDEMHDVLSGLQDASFAARTVASEEASVVFGLIHKAKPIEKKVKRSKTGKGTRNNKEAIANSKPERLLTRDKTAKLFSTHVVEEIVETPVAVNRGKRRVALNTSTPVPEREKQVVVPEKRKKENGTIKKRTSNRLSKTVRISTKEDEEPTYCFCSRVSYGEMIGCDNEKCEIEWFHFECIGLTTKPKGKWFCPNCRLPENPKVMKTGGAKKDSNGKDKDDRS